MPLEIEAKMKVDDLPALLQRLSAVGATPVGQVLETNIFYDRPDLSLRKAGHGLRVRVAEEAASGRRKVTITHKGAQLPGPLKTRPETELTVFDAQAASALLNSLGFVQVLRFQKRRRSWLLGDCRVELDEVPMLGHFVEVEGPSDDSVQRVRALLGLDASPLIPSSYAALLAAHLEARGESRRDIVFEQA